MDSLHVADAISAIFNLFKRCNKYIDETEPWVLSKDDSKKDRLSTVLYNLCDSIVIGSALLHPFLPGTSEKILSELRTEMPSFSDIDQKGRGLFASGTILDPSPETLFQRLKLDDVMKRIPENHTDER